MILYYIRHGDPIYRPDSLTPLGKREAEAVAKRLAVYGVDAIYSSTSNRAIETAAPLAELLKKEPVQLDFANEKYASMEFGVPDPEKEGKRRWAWGFPEYAQAMLSPEVRAMGDAWWTHPAFAQCGFGEGIARVNRESDSFLKTLGYVHDRENHVYYAEQPNDQRIALFAHAGFGFVFLSSILDIPYPDFCTHFDMRTSGMTVIDFRQHGDFVVPKVLTYSSDSHIYKEGLPLAYNGHIRF